MADELAQHSSDEPLQGRDRDHLIFVLSAMAEKADACASAWIDQIEASREG
ncbi:hypothetical protein [Paracoccus nototheniae]|uniref:Uncharacterized protein n=1 Tax=Paracoccus nototheniae TaxID=2489002 RepID=A0ABW4DVW1_9RHOB|nr:hypothetical protein [Paracoccus nototheniae]